jgi:hypothetical protein
MAGIMDKRSGINVIPSAGKRGFPGAAILYNKIVKRYS